MKIIALYKIFRGHEFFRQSLESIYKWVDGIVAVSSNIGWDGSTGNNTLNIIQEYPDPLKKITVLEYDSREQNNQYAEGLRYIQKIYGKDVWILLVDSDEVWDDKSWLAALPQIQSTPVYISAYIAKMHTYIKSPLYRVADDKGLQVKPRVFVRADVSGINTRGASIGPARMLDGVCIHHFALVRDSLDEIFQKMTTSRIGDGHRPPLVNLEKWKKETWDRIPGPAAHYYAGCERVWERTIRIESSELPLSIQKLLEVK